MEFGFCLPDSGPLATPEVISTLAKQGEEMGFSILGVSDHIVMPRGVNSTYPYNETGQWQGGVDCLEVLTTLSFVAAHTAKARIVSWVMVLPYRPPISTAKILATIDVLSKGRLIVGVGVGWMKEEFEALGSPPYEERGAASDEYIEIFKELWTSTSPAYDGKYCKFSDVDFLPRPVQTPHPPIWVGGESAPALRRTARVGDAWFPISNNPRFPVLNVKQMKESVARIHHHAEKIGRDPAEIEVAYSPASYNSQEVELDSNGDKLPLTGKPQQVADDIKAFEAAGVGSTMVSFAGNTLDEWLSELDRFAHQVMPLANS